MTFFTVLKSVLTMLFFISVGFAIVKARKAASGHARSLSAILVYLCTPCLMISSFYVLEYSRENLIKTLEFGAISLIIQILFLGILYLIFRRKYSHAKYRVLTVAAALGNVGFFGLPVITSIFPSDSIVACYSTIYVVSMNLICFTLGIFLISNNKKFVSVRNAILNPTTLSFIAALPIYYFQIKLPASIADTIILVGKMSTPICMLIVGFRLASMDLKGVFTQKFAYLAAVLKLIVYPLLALGIVSIIPGLDDIFRISMFVLSCAPTGVVVLSLAELHECEQKTTANVVLLSTLLSVITIPLLMLLV